MTKFYRPIGDKACVLPVGSIYLSVSTTNPSKWFGGTWTRVADGHYLIGYDPANGWFNHAGEFKGSTNGPGDWNTGSTTLSVNQIPSHQHTGNTAGAGYHDHQIALNGDDGFNVWYRLNWGNSHTGYCITGNNTNGQSSGASFPSIAKGNGNHAHSFTTDATGGSQGHNHFHVSPYYTVVVWRRTA